MQESQSISIMTRTCSNCLNAYNNPYTHEVRCWNREWLAEFDPKVKTSVGPDETCGTYQMRAANQKPLVFKKLVWPYLFDEMNN